MEKEVETLSHKASQPVILSTSCRWICRALLCSKNAASLAGKPAHATGPAASAALCVPTNPSLCLHELAEMCLSRTYAAALNVMITVPVDTAIKMSLSDASLTQA